jgi:protoporphyrinogen oxidase
VNVAVVGGGMSGLAAAWELLRLGHRPVVFEKEVQPGGLSTWFEADGVGWDRFYHVVLSTDEALAGLIAEIGLADQIGWRETKTGFWIDGRLVSLSTTTEFITFPGLSLWDKFRLGLGILYTARLRDHSRLERVYVREWLTRVFGRRNYERLWGPLLYSKLGTAREKASAAFIWATIQRLYGTRRSAAKKEMMGAVRGGYRTILTRLVELIRERGGEVRLAQPATRVRGDAAGATVVSSEGERRFDRVVCTVPNPEALRLLDPIEDAEFRARLEGVTYLGVVVVLVVLDRTLSPYYVINLTDTTLPFTGIIEATNLAGPEQLGGKALVYLPKYLPPGDPLASAPDEQVRDQFLAQLRRVFPDLDAHGVGATHVFRAPLVQPLHELRYSEHMPPMRTPLPNVFLANTSMIANTTLNNNAAVRLAREAARLAAG